MIFKQKQKQKQNKTKQNKTTTTTVQTKRSDLNKKIKNQKINIFTKTQSEITSPRTTSSTYI